MMQVNKLTDNRHVLLLMFKGGSLTRVDVHQHSWHVNHGCTLSNQPSRLTQPGHPQRAGTVSASKVR